MRRYSFQPRDHGLKGYRFLSFSVNICLHIGRHLINNVVNIVKIVLIMLSNLKQMCLKLLQKRSFKKQWRQPVI